MASPELCFVELSSCVGHTAALEAGCELCGIFGRGDGPAEGSLPRVNQATSAAGIAAYAARLKHWKGANTARDLAGRIFDRAASPYEIKMGILLTTACCKGGLGFDMPLFNHLHQVPAELRGVVAQATYESDCFWPEHALALEYDSDLHRLTSKAHAHDSEKRNALRLMGIDTITLTRGQLVDPELAEGFALVLARCMGKRRRVQTRDYASKSAGLRAELFG